MKEVMSDIDRWRAAGSRVAVARVVGVEGSGPRDPGATMAVNEHGDVAGSVSGGCVEGAVVTEALDALNRGTGPRRCTFGYSDDEAFAVGLTCGGTIHVLVDPGITPLYESLRSSLAAEEPVALATVAELTPEEERPDPLPALGATMLVRQEGEPEGSLGEEALDRVVWRDALGALQSGLSTTRHYGPHGEARQRDVAVFLEIFAPPPRMVIFGAVDFTAALARMAKVLGYRVTVCDARPVFATSARFPMADEVVVDWPNRHLAEVGPTLSGRDAVCVLTHDPKFDVPAIEAALGTAVGYLGAMGSRRTHADRMARLRDAGVEEEGIARVMAPIGLDIGARTPEETAVSICAEIIAHRTGRAAPSLRDAEGPIHHGREAPAPA
ncbi:MAG TPA: XdhC/CoxI family protein [Acidimicrobiales bacterium]|nr:XdhC/CoxI family protein [Acidimicrobiales bacterium]